MRQVRGLLQVRDNYILAISIPPYVMHGICKMNTWKLASPACQWILQCVSCSIIFVYGICPLQAGRTSSLQILLSLQKGYGKSTDGNHKYCILLWTLKFSHIRTVRMTII